MHQGLSSKMCYITLWLCHTINGNSGKYAQLSNCLLSNCSTHLRPPVTLLAPIASLVDGA